MQANQQVSFLTDGGEDVRQLPLYLHPGADCLLDWFHITMRITVMGQMAKSVRSPPPRDDSEDPSRSTSPASSGASSGSSGTATCSGPSSVEDLADDLYVEEPEPERRKLCKAVRELTPTSGPTPGPSPSYAERHLAGEAIFTGFVESTVNQVISKRMVKRQQMRWTPRGAHLLVQVRTHVLNDALADDFHRWYPGYTHTTNRDDLAA